MASRIHGRSSQFELTIGEYDSNGDPKRIAIGFFAWSRGLVVEIICSVFSSSAEFTIEKKRDPIISVFPTLSVADQQIECIPSGSSIVLR